MTRLNALIAAAVIVLFSVGAYTFLKPDLHFPLVEIVVPGNLDMIYVNFGTLKIEDCEASRRKFFSAAMQSCPGCKAIRNYCASQDSEEVSKAIGLEPLMYYSIATPSGYVVLKGANQEILRETCKQIVAGLTSRHLASRCYGPGENRLP